MCASYLSKTAGVLLHLYCIYVLDSVEVLVREIIVSKVEVVQDLQEAVEVGIQEVMEVTVVVEDTQVISCVATCYLSFKVHFRVI
jgi:hypothetical protein